MSGSQQLKAELESLLPPLRRFAFSLTTSMPDADDLVQKTVERILTRPVPDDVELVKWAFRVCRNLWIDEHRARKVRESAAFETELHDARNVDGASAIESELELGHVGVAMRRLPKPQHEVLAMIAVQGMSYREVSEALEVPIGTVMSRLARARTALTEQLYGNQEGFH